MTINHIVILNNIFTRIVVIAFDTLLCCFKRLRHRLILNRRFLIHAQTIHERRNALALEYTHQVIFGTYVELGIARVALAAATPTQLIVNTS